eukprot:390357-Prymnesium_polylepis.1
MARGRGRKSMWGVRIGRWGGGQRFVSSGLAVLCATFNSLDHTTMEYRNLRIVYYEYDLEFDGGAISS